MRYAAKEKNERRLLLLFLPSLSTTIVTATFQREMRHCVDAELWSHLMKQCAWNAFFHIFTLIQRLVWLFTGTQWTIVSNRLYLRVTINDPLRSVVFR